MSSHIERATEMLAIYGQAIRGDWSMLDGRVIRDDLDEIAAVVNGGDLTVEDFCSNAGICRRCRGWKYNCDCEATND